MTQKLNKQKQQQQNCFCILCLLWPLLFNGTQKRKVKPRMKCLKQLMFVLILSFFSLKNTEFTLCESWVVTGPHRPRFWGFTAKKNPCAYTWIVWSVLSVLKTTMPAERNQILKTTVWYSVNIQIHIEAYEVIKKHFLKSRKALIWNCSSWPKLPRD